MDYTGCPPCNAVVVAHSPASPITVKCGKQDMQEAMKGLPKGTETCIVEGGNHRGFAAYSRQPMDWEVR